MMRAPRHAAVVALSALCVAEPASAAAVPGYSFTGGFDSISPVGTTVGYWFYVRPGENVAVSELGFVDTGSDGLSTSHVVGF